MKGNSFISISKSTLSEYYHHIFKSSWPIWVGSIFIPILALCIFLWKAPWGIAGGYLNLGSWFYHFIGVYEIKPLAPWLHPIFLSTFGLFIGAWSSALISREFKIRKASGIEYLKGIAGGSLMGVGAALSSGCNVGGFFTAIAMFSFGGFMMWCGLIIGAFVGLKILMWELDKFPPKLKKVKYQSKPKSSRSIWQRYTPIAGGGIILVSVLQLYIAGQFNRTSYAGLIFIGLLLGIVMHRTRFCFAGAFRDPFMTGDNRMIKAVVVALIIYCFGSAIIKWNYIQPHDMGVHHVWFGSLLGGFVFGVGMLLAGGCASSALWRMAEGHTKYLVIATSFCLSNPIALLLINKYHLLSIFGKPQFLPDKLGWEITLPLILLFFGLWAMVAAWNEKTERFVY